MEYSASSQTKLAMEQAHQERARVFSEILKWVFRRRLVVDGAKVSRWA